MHMQKHNVYAGTVIFGVLMWYHMHIAWTIYFFKN